MHETFYEPIEQDLKDYVQHRERNTVSRRGFIKLDNPSHVTVKILNPVELDLAIRRYLPASVEELRVLIEKKIGGAADFSDVSTISELLIFLAAHDSACL